MHSVLSCLLKCTNDWYLDIDKGNFTSVTFIDLKKAFDIVNHEILLNKIQSYGMKDKELCWFPSNLLHRKQCCKIGGQISKFEDITCGVPQGSCLGPLLFLVYINDLRLSLNYSEVHMYADDTSISFSSDSITEINKKVNYGLLCLKTRMKSNKLSINVAKTQTILIGGRKKLKNINNSETQNLQIVIDQEPVSKIKHTKYLRIVVDQFLNWEEHISALIKKIPKEIRILRYGKRYLPLTTVKSMYRSVVEPHFRFCCSVWGICSAIAFDKLQKLQNRAARIATNSPYDAPSQPLLKKLGWQPIKELINIETAMMVYRSMNNEAPSYLMSLLERSSQNTVRKLRNTKTDLKLPLLKISSGQKCFSYRGARLWNNLSADAKNAQTKFQFKNAYNISR